MIQITPQMRILLAVEPADFRKGIDGLYGVGPHLLHNCATQLRFRRKMKSEMRTEGGASEWGSARGEK